MVQPYLTSSTAILLSTTFTSSYLLSIYVLPSSRPSITRSRDTPSLIRSRLLSASLSTLTSLALFPFLLPSIPAPPQLPSTFALSAPSAYSLRTSARLLGLAMPLSGRWSDVGRAVGCTMALTAALFAGSLWIKVGVTKEWTWTGFKSLFSGRGKDKIEGDEKTQLEDEREERAEFWTGIRNFVLGPLTEELVFRSCIVTVSALAGFSKAQIIFLSPLYFGLAHIHHAYSAYVDSGRTAEGLKMAILSSTFQFAYTTLFGWYATFIFMRTGSVLPPFLIHSFCNYMGLPPLDYVLSVYPEKKISVLSTYVIGIGMFVAGFWSMTDPRLFGASVYWF